MNDPNTDGLTWTNLTWQDIQAISMALAERHAEANMLAMAPERLAQLVADLPGFAAGGTAPDAFTLSAIVTAWIAAADGDDDQDKMLGIDPAEAQRRFKALQLRQQVQKNYASTARALFGAAH